MESCKQAHANKHKCVQCGCMLLDSMEIAFIRAPIYSNADWSKSESDELDK